MTIIQKHGSSLPSKGTLNPFQFGWYEGDKLEGSSKFGDLYIADKDGNPVKVTDSAENRLEKTIDAKFDELNSKITKGQLHTMSIQSLLAENAQFNEGKLEKKYAVNDQFIVYSSDKDNPINNGDTYLYIVDIPTPEELDAADDEYQYISIGSDGGATLYAVRSTCIEYAYHDAVAVDAKFVAPSTTPAAVNDAADEGDPKAIAFKNASATNNAIVTYAPDEINNSIVVDLSEKAKKILDGVDALGIVSDGSSDSPFAGGFMTKIEKVELGQGKTVGDKTVANSAIYITYKAQRKQADGSFKEIEEQPVVVDLNDLVIDEGEW